MGRTRVWPGAAVALLMAAGCGGGGSGGSSAGTSPQALASSINLRASDLPGYTVAGKGGSGTNDPQGEALAECAGSTPPSEAVADVSSDQFQRGASGPGAVVVGSDVTVMPSADQGIHDLAALRAPLASSCLEAKLRPELQKEVGSGVRVTDFRIERIGASAPGTAGAIGLRVLVTLKGPGGTVDVSTDLRAFVLGRLEVTLFDTAIDGPFPDDEAQQLFSLLVQRARAAA